MTVKIKKLNDAAVIPTRGTEHSAGMDLTAVSKEVVDNGKHGYVNYGTGLAFAIPEGHVGLLFPRSSISKTGLILSNSAGVIDSDYRGEVTMRFKHIKDTDDYNIGDRIGQLIIVPYPQVTFEEVSDLDETVRGTGGYGSTGN